MSTDRTDEHEYDALRMRQWLAGEADARGLSRRHLLRLGTAAAAAVPLAATPALAVAAPGSAAPAAPATAAEPAGPIRKPLPPELFFTYGTNAETRWEAMAGQGYHTPVDRFFVRNHTSTPEIDPETWRLRLFGSGLRHGPVELSLRDLRRLPADTYDAAIECTGNGRSFFTTQQGQPVSGTAWKLGAVGVARWRGVRLSTVLRRAGIRPDAVDVLPEGLDDEWVSGGVNLGRVRRPLPVAKAMRDVLLAYEMNGEPLPPDHGFPVRVVVPGWIGIAAIKWLGRIEVSTGPLFSPWNTQFYRLFGPTYPADGELIGRQVVKSAFELPWAATLAAGRTHVLHGRSWSGNGPIRRVEVSTDGGASWHPATATGRRGGAWQQWSYRWRPAGPGAYALRARAVDVTGAGQPEVTPFNTLGYLFDAVVAHPVTVA
ncbi:sulfite oxidase [Dactylosporangium aurantiacum]|uniref:Sulfite oxidase n=1 Tax=Dactylosporangium aurantiacum TaxID=35754 RepID=A0A9Q9MM50_9ACTN|nr:sulfite oxidase [Dactylosporangium aurantiacum]MDG6103196.1 sulfite oxidase [Dactylosporangium aurantiacum]UWZ57701.1 sulfite oxidase [Dactylosporangium aurantiacum]